MLSRGRTSNVKLLIELEQVPVLVNPNPQPEAELTVRAKVNVESKKSLEGKSIRCSLTGERLTPAVEGEGVLGGSSAKNTERFLHREQELHVPTGESKEGFFCYDIPVEFQLSPQLPGTLRPLSNKSSSVRYFLTARLDTGKFFGSVSHVKDLTIQRACRSDTEGLGSLIDTTTDFEDGLSCTAWTPRSVLFGSRARIELSFRRLSDHVEIETAIVTLKERQTTSVAVPAAYQQRPGEHKKLVAESDICSRTVDFPSLAPDSTERPDTVILDLNLPKDEKFHRRTTSHRAGIELQHYFDIVVSTKTGALNLTCDTILSFSLEDDQAAQMPPSYNEAAPPNYYEHSLDDVYDKGRGDDSAQEGRVLFLTTGVSQGIELSPAQEKTM